MDTTAAALRARMKERGDSANDLAARFGVTQPTISRWLNGKGSPGSQRIGELAHYLDRPYEEVAAMLARSATTPAADERALALARLEAVERALVMVLEHLEVPVPPELRGATRAEP